MTRKIVRPKKPGRSEQEKAYELNTLWCELEDTMGEQAAYNVACSQLGIDPDDGYDLLATHSEYVNNRTKLAAGVTV